MTSYQKRLGAAGEKFSAEFLSEKGFEIIAMNVCAQGGEIDIIAKKSDESWYRLVEVKTRSNANFGDVFESINERKLIGMMRAADRYFIDTLGMPDLPEVQIDVIALQKTSSKNSGDGAENFDIEWLENVGF